MYKKQAGDPPSSKITERNILKSMWDERKHRASPTYSPLVEGEIDTKLSVAAMFDNADPLLQMPFNDTATTEEDITQGYV